MSNVKLTNIPKILPDELVAKSLYPALRSMIAIELINKYNFKQIDAAKKLGVTQAAISYYVTDKRGITKIFIKSKVIKEVIEKIAQKIAENKLKDDEIILVLTKLTDYIMKNRFLCEIHKELEKNLIVDDCHICDKRYEIDSDEFLKKLLEI